MPITATNGALTYSRTNLGDPNFTYWMLTGTSSIASLKGMYVDKVNSVLYIQTTETSTNKPSFIKLNRLVGPEIEYNKTYTITSPSGGTYNFMGYMGYDTSRNAMMIPFRYSRPYTPTFPYYTVNTPVLLDIDTNDGSVLNDYSRWPIYVPPNSNNSSYTTPFESAYDASNTLYITTLDAGQGSYTLAAVEYSSPTSTQLGVSAVNYGTNGNANLEIGRIIFDSSGRPFYSSLIYGTTSNEIRWYTNAAGAASPPQYILGTVYASSFTLASKRLQVGGVALDSGQNRIGVIGNTTDNVSYVVKMSSTQTLTWQKSISGVRLYNVITDSADNIYVAGTVVSTGRVYVAKFDSSGNIIYQRQIYGPGTNGIPNIDCDATSIYLSFSTGNTPFTPFITRLPNDGTLTGSYTVGTLAITYASISQTIGTGTLSVATPVNTIGNPNSYAYPLSISTSVATGSNSSNRIPIS